jgi:hypothetical protein
MAETKKIEISADIKYDSSNVTAFVKEMQEQLSKIQPISKVPSAAELNKQSIAMGGVPLSQTAQQSLDNTRIKGQKAIADIINIQTKSLNEAIAKTKLLQEEESKLLKLKDKNKLLDENSLKIASERVRQAQIEENTQKITYASTIEEARKVSGTPQLQRGQSEQGVGDGVSSLQKIPILGSLATIAGVISIVKAATQGPITYAETQKRIDVSQAETANNLSDVAKSIFSGGLVKEEMFSPERESSTKQAEKEQEAVDASNKFRAKLLKPVIGLGEILGGAGSLLQGIKKGNINLEDMSKGFAAGGMAAGAIGGKVFGEQAANLAKAKTGLPGAANEYTKAQTAEFTNRQQQDLQALKQKEWLKGMAIDTFQSQMQQNQAFGRLTGIGEEKLYGTGESKGESVFDTASASQFRRARNIEAAQGMMGAGGSSQDALRNMGAANVFERQFGMTNASQMMGKFSGTGLESKEAMFQFLSKSFAHGMDSSKTPELLRMVGTQVSETVNLLGVRSQAGVADITEQMMKFKTDDTTRGAQGAKTAFEETQTKLGGAGGIVGAMKAQKFSSLFPKLDTNERQTLMEMRPEDVRTDNPFIRGLAKEAGMGDDIQGFVDKIKKTLDQVSTPFQSQADLRKQIEGRRKEFQKKNPKGTEAQFQEQEGGLFAKFGASLKQTGMTDLVPGSPEWVSKMSANTGGGEVLETDPAKMMSKAKAQYKAPISNIWDKGEAAEAKQEAIVRNKIGDVFKGLEETINKINTKPLEDLIKMMDTHQKNAQAAADYLKSTLDLNTAHKDGIEPLRQTVELVQKLSGKGISNKPSSGPATNR